MVQKANPLKCLILTHEYPPVGGGAAYVAEQLCHALDKLGGIDLSVLTSSCQETPIQMQKGNVSIKRIAAARKYFYQGSLVSMGVFAVTSFLSLVFRFTRNKKKRPSIVHAHFMYPSGLIAFLLKKIFSISYIITFHGGDIPGNDPAVERIFSHLKPLTQAIMKNADALVSVSRSSIPLIIKSGGEKVHYIPNGTVANGTCRPPLENRTMELLFVGRLVTLKQVDILLHAVTSLPDSLLWKLTICGDGPEAASLKELAVELGINERVVFRGWLPHKEISKLYEKADTFLLPSHSEGLSLSALEAMGAGIPLILSDIPSNREIVEDGINGYLCVAAPEAMAAAIIECSRHLTHLSAGAIRTASRFDWEKIAHNYMKLLLMDRKSQ